MSIYIDFHILQTVPPSCVNRDDTGSPKTAIYGGQTRARVSSQAWKHAIREYFKGIFEKESLGSRTLFLTNMIAEEIKILDSNLTESECTKKANDVLAAAGFKFKNSKDDSDKVTALFFMSNKQAKALAKHAVELDLKEKDSKKILLNDLKENNSVDIALFGRMAADAPTLNCDACSQVAHAISTHAVQNEYDYFTAVDDLQKEDNAGAGHLGTVEFNSSTLYRYATVNASELAKTLKGDDIGEVVGKFAKSLICSMPAGKENTFANRTLPGFVYVTIREDQPINLCGAFEKAVKKSDDGYIENSEKALKDYAKNIYEKYATEPKKAFYIGDNFDDMAESMTLPQMLEAIKEEVNTEIGRNGE